MPRTRPIVVNIHADSVDVIALKARVSQVKVELRSSLRIIERTKDRTFWRQQLEKNLREAARLHGPRDKELQELVAQAEKWFDLDPS